MINISPDLLDRSQSEEYFLIRTAVWRQIADDLLARDPAVTYVEVRDKVDDEITTILRQYSGRLDKYLEERGNEFVEGIGDL
jgi:hypothetical protein